MNKNETKNHTKVALVTGGTTGIGKSIVHKLAKKGYITYASTRKMDSEAVTEIKKLAVIEKLKITPIQLDLTKPQSIKKSIDEIIKNEGRIDILINNAASGYFSAIEDIETDKFMESIETNVAGVIETIKNVLPHMREQRSGKIFNISSILGFCTVPLNGPYSASKYAIESISETLATEVKPFGIDVIILQPGDFHSEFVKKAIHAKFDEKSPYYKLYKRQKDKIESGTQGRDPEILANKVVEICELKHPRLRYMIGREVLIKKILHFVMYDDNWIKFLRRFYKW